MNLALQMINENEYKSCCAYIATKGHGKYFCPECGEPVYKRDGGSNVAHFAHEKSCSCEGGINGTYHEMSEWHKKWQEMFPEECREIWAKDEITGKCHRADVLINNLVIEFQHSNISKDKLLERSLFWIGKGFKVVWLFDLRGYCIESRESNRYICYNSIDAFKEFKKEDLCNGLNVFVEGRLPINIDHVVFEKGFNIFKLDSITGTNEINSILECDSSNLNNFYNKTRFLLYCGIEKNIKTYSIDEIVEHYPDSSTIGIYNYCNGATMLIKNGLAEGTQKDWLPIYHTVSERQIKEFEEQKRKNIEDYRRRLEERKQINSSAIIDNINEIENLFKKRYEEGFAANQKFPNGVGNLEREISECLSSFSLSIKERLEFHEALMEYGRCLDGYYLALHRNLLEFAEQRKQNIIEAKEIMTTIIKNAEVNHL